jgi:hypothetical protein
MHQTTVTRRKGNGEAIVQGNFKGEIRGLTEEIDNECERS